MDSFSRLALAGTALLSILGAAVAGRLAEPPADYAIRDNVDFVLLDVAVQKPNGEFASGLTREDFVIYDDGRPQVLSHFSAMDAPVTVGLIVDNSGSMRPKRSEIVMAGLAFAKSSNPQDEFFVVNFNDRVYSAMPADMPFTDQLQVLRSALFMGNPAGRTALYDAIAKGLDQLSKGHRPLKTLIVVSDGGDNASEIRSPELLRLIAASRATIYTIGMLDPDNRDWNAAVLRKMSTLTGGAFFAPATSKDVLSAFEKISADMRHRYTLGFIPATESDTHRVHTLRVRVHDGAETKYVVRSRRSYVTDSPSKS